MSTSHFRYLSILYCAGERSVMPMSWVTIDAIGRGWKEVERFIEAKCEIKPLTRAEEDELHELREWLKYSDQELALPLDAMKGNMEKVIAAEPEKEYSLPPTATTVVRPFSVH